MPRKSTARWQVWVTTKVFSFATELSGFVLQQRVLCHDRIWSRQGVSRSRQGFSWL